MADSSELGSDKPVDQLTDQELQAALSTFGSASIPVTTHTRGLLERKLVKLLRAQREPSAATQDDENVLSDEPIEKKQEPQETVVESDKHDGEFYGVVVEGEGTPGHSSLSPFYTNKSDALKAVKSVPGARFKKFNSRASAEAFSCSPAGAESRYSSPVTTSRGQSPSMTGKQASSVSEKKPNTFPSLQTQDLTRLRSVIKSGDVTRFSTEVWGNPRYLVNCARDSPEILHIGCHYNALHCAVRTGHLEMCQELMTILQNGDFWQLLFPNDSPDVVLQRRTHLVDLFLNMQDKLKGETPLHFASKLGHLEIARLLLSQPALDTSITNKEGKRAIDIVCENASSKELKDKLKELIQAPPLYYVPILRAADNCTPPQLTPPCTITEYCLHQTALSDDRGSPVIGQAIAGPMSPAQAETFYQEWRSPSNSREWREALQIKRSDPSRGFERVGRQLAEIHDVRWREYWDFLGGYCDLRKPEGLQKLEHFLSSSSLSTPPPPPPPPLPSSSSPASSPPAGITPHDGMVTGGGNVSRELFPCDDEDETEEEEHVRNGNIGGGVSGVRAISGKGIGGGGEGGGGREGEGKEEKREGEDVESVLEGLGGLTLSKVKDEQRDNKTRKPGGGGGGGGGDHSIGEGEPHNQEKEVDNREVNDKGGGGEHNESNNRLKRCSDNLRWVDSQITPSTRRNINFIMGKEPTKVDYDVYLAVKGAPDLPRYPCVLKWISLIEGYSENIQKGWRTPQTKLRGRPVMEQDTASQETRRSPLLVTSPPHSPLSRPPVLPSSVSPPPHRLQTATLSPRRHFSPLHRSFNTGTGNGVSTPSRLHNLNAGTAGNGTSTPSRLHHLRATPKPRQVLSNNPLGNN